MLTAPIHLSRSEIDDDRWNQLISQSRQGVVYGVCGYLDIVCAQWEALVWPSASNYQVIMPIPVVYKLGIKAVQQPLFCQYLGLFSQSELTKVLFTAFIKQLTNSYKYISSYHFNPENTSLFRSWDIPVELKIDESHTHLLNLENSFDQISGQYSRDRRSNLKRSIRENWECYDDMNAEPLLNMFHDHHEKKIKGGVNVSAYDLFRKLTSIASSLYKVKVLYAGRNGIYCAGIVLLEFAGKTIYIFNAANQEGRDGNGRTWLLNNYFKANADSKLVFDFESPDIQPIAEFYESFGAVATPYLRVHINKLPFPLNKLQSWRRGRLRS